MKPGRRRGPFLAAMVAAALVIAACGDGENAAVEDTTEDTAAQADADEGTGGEDDQAADDGWPEREIRMALGSSAGGGIDTSMRQVHPHMAEALGADIVIENHSAGSGAVAGTLVASDETCDTILGWAIPHLISSYVIQDTGYTYDDFYPLGRVVVDAGTIVVPVDTRWETMQDMIDEAIESPGSITVSVGSFQNAYYMGLIQLEEATGAEFNIVPMGGGSEARNAVAGGQVDWTYAAVYNRLPVEDETTVLAVVADDNEWPDLTDDAPTINEALGTDLPPVEPSYGMFTSRSCFENHPDRFERLENALAEGMQAEAFQSTLADLGESDRYSHRTADQYHEAIVAAEPEIVTFLEEHAEDE